MMSTTHKKNKRHRIAFSISDRDYELLTLYAASKNTTKGHIAKQVLHSELLNFKKSIGELPAENQLSLFNAHQTDIFDYIDDEE